MNEPRATLILREARLADIDAVRAVCAKAFPEIGCHSAAQLRGQIQNFPQGQIVAEHDGAIVGYCATFIAPEALTLTSHSWDEITGGGFASRHTPHADWLYGMDVLVDPDRRGLRIGQRLCAIRKRICRRLGLKGIVIASRMPGLHRAIRKAGSAEAYAQGVRGGRLRDPVLTLHLRRGFELIGLIRDYRPGDTDSLGYGAHLVWRNPAYVANDPRAERVDRAIKDKVRISVVQYRQRRVASFADFARHVEYFVHVAADYKADFIVFPELFTLQLLSIETSRIPARDAIAKLDAYTADLKDLLSRLAVACTINIIGGSHPTRTDSGAIHNIAYVCLRDGSIHEQAKIHPTPNERSSWNIEGGDELTTIMTDCGPIGVLICYDSEFPELARSLVDQGARLLFVPFCTDDRQGYLRVRYCSQARAVENQCYVAIAGNCGNLPGVDNMDIQYAQSAIFTPCDMPFARDGIAADTTPNAEMVAFADLSLADLDEARRSGTVRNLSDRRFDLYGVSWKHKR